MCENCLKVIVMFIFILILDIDFNYLEKYVNLCKFICI